MTCPKCASENIGVIRTIDEVDHIIRQRRCHDCGYQFRTIETETDIYTRLEKGKHKNADNQ